MPTFSGNLQKISFPGQYPDEPVILIIRRHPIALFAVSGYVAVMLLLPAFAYIILAYFFKISLNGTAFELFLFASGVYMLFLAAITFTGIINFYFNVWIISDQRIIAIEQEGLFNRVINEVRYERIQDITSEVQGIIPTFFKFGDILIDTASENDRMIMKQIPDPVETRRVIAEAYKKAMDKMEGAGPALKTL